MPYVPEFYIDLEFQCRDCGTRQTWTASRQKYYYEVLKGEIEGKPIRCRSCRERERLRKAEVRRLQLEGMEKKKNSRPS